MSKTQLEVGDKLYFISETGTIQLVKIMVVKENIAYSLSISFETDISSGSVTVIKNLTGLQGEFHLPMKELEQAYQEQQTKAQFKQEISKAKKWILSTDQMKRILAILAE